MPFDGERMMYRGFNGTAGLLIDGLVKVASQLCRDSKVGYLMTQKFLQNPWESLRSVQNNPAREKKEI